MWPVTNRLRTIRLRRGAIMSEPSRTVLVQENEPLVGLLRAKREELLASADVLRVKGDVKRADGKQKYVSTIDRAWCSLCDHRTAITTPQEAKKLKNVGNWILGVLQPYFEERNDAPSRELASQPLGANGRMKKKYIPAKNSGGYALLITLLSAFQNGREFMMKMELIDEADKSGLSTKPIRDSGLPWTGGQPNPKDLYSGWSSMGTLIRNSLVVKTSNPAKYMLTDEGKSVAQQCMDRGGLASGNRVRHEIAREEERRGSPVREVSGGHNFGGQESSSSDEDVKEIRRPDPPSKEKRRRKNNVHISSSSAGDHGGSADTMDLSRNNYGHYCRSPSRAVQGNATVQSSTVDPDFELAVPPLEAGERFSDVYEIICILDNREQFKRTTNTHLQQFVDSLKRQFEVKVETRVLPVGDALWIARHKQRNEEYVLEFVLERKSVHDLWTSIKEPRYKKQKLRLLNCGLKRLLYLVEGDVNNVESTETLKTAMLSTELEGFRLLKTDDTTDTCKQYGHLTRAIISRYSVELGKRRKPGQVSTTYKGFVDHCNDFRKDRVKDIFCRQLTQIGQVTEEIALSIQDRYPTLSSIVAAFEELEGNQEAQEKLLQGIPIRNTSKTISAGMSKNVYKAIWAP